MKIGVFLFLILFSGITRSIENPSVQGYINNPEILNVKIHTIESSLKNNLSSAERDSLEKLRWNLIDLKNSIPLLQEEKGLMDAISLAEKMKWENTLTELYQIKKICAAVPLNENECLIEISSFDSFVETRAIGLIQKNLLKTSVEAFGKTIQARLLINENFVSHTNALLASSQEALVVPDAPLVTVKIAPAKKLIPVTAEKKNNLVAVKALESALPLKVGVGLFFLLVLGIIFARKFQTKKKIDNFYAQVFYKIRKTDQKIRLFGKIKPLNAQKLDKISASYLDFFANASAVKSNIDIKMKNREEKLIIETVFYTSNPIQETLKMESIQAMSEKLSLLESRLMSLSGELILSNSFDNTGKISNTSITIIL